MSLCLVLKVLKDLALSEWRVPNVPISLGYWQQCWVSSANYCGDYQMVKLRNSDTSKCWPERAAMEPFIHHEQEWKMTWLIWKAVWQFLTELITLFAHNLVIAALGTY